MNVVYMLECEDGSFYIGWTNDLEKRMRAHFSGRGAKYTKAHRPVRLVYLERYEEKREAQRREYALKKLGHRERAALAEGFVLTEEVRW
ncbi:MAG: GIY-YIG nuclease family protein [Lachnospiraceae bacterium]|nr:GIY-YIG nuclease family protein [Lachnospiraceae bacterium]